MKQISWTVAMIGLAFALSFSLRTHSAPKHTIKGKVVDTENQPIPGIAVKLKRGIEIIEIVSTDQQGKYSVIFDDGDGVSLIYDGSEYFPGDIRDISGAADHDITKVLKKWEESAQLSYGQASQLLETLDFMVRNQGPTSQSSESELKRYLTVVNSVEIPDELRTRELEFKGSVSERLGY